MATILIDPILRDTEIKRIRILGIFLLAIAFPSYILASNSKDLLILQDIGSYKFMAKGGGGHGSGILSPTGHFSKDHVDESYASTYIDRVQRMGINVEVTQHAGADSDRWLLHELDDSFRDEYGIPSNSYGPRLISGQTVYVISIGGRGYRWLSGNTVLEVSYHGSLRTLPEPLEVVEAYLAKYPSTLAPITLKELRSTASNLTWIKDEMERRLWLCDKWFYQLQLKKVDESRVYKEAYDSMMIFLNYRAKYYRQSADSEKQILSTYLSSNNGTGIRTKLEEYKKWWAAHKADSISL